MASDRRGGHGERQQNPTGASQRGIVGLLVAAGRVQQLLAEVCERYGITHDQYNVLRVLRGVHPRGHPRYEASWEWQGVGEQAGGILTITLRQMQRDEAFLTPLTVEFVMPGATTKRDTIRPTAKETVAQFKLSRRPAEVRIDPDDFVLKELSQRETR